MARKQLPNDTQPGVTGNRQADEDPLDAAAEALAAELFARQWLLHGSYDSEHIAAECLKAATAFYEIAWQRQPAPRLAETA